MGTIVLLMVTRGTRWPRVVGGILWLLAATMPVAAQDRPGSPEAGPPNLQTAAVPANYDGPPPPTMPQTIARDGTGRVSLRANRLTAPLDLDGRLGESLYAETPSMSGFVQNEPAFGAPATERTEVWVFFDDTNLYLATRVWESEPDRMVVNEMRRDSLNVQENENIAFMLDTFYDRRNSVVFIFNPAGGRIDGQVTNESQANSDWNPVWRLEVGVFEGGWSAEAGIPFRSLRYGPGRAQVWGLNVRRMSRWKNEISFLSEVPAGVGAQGIRRASVAATLFGLEAPPVARNLEVKPFLISDVSKNAATTPAQKHEIGGDIGLDVKYGLTPNLTADLTVNTDFAQVEADLQQVNLTRFSLFFPEKREFFLENQGLFQFGGAAGRGAVPFMFYSRRIGLDNGAEVPIRAGVRLTGRVGAFGVGGINIQTDESGSSPATNFTVVRLQRDVLRRSAIGAMVTRRSVSTRGLGSNDLFGVDGRFAFFENLTVNTYWARTRTNGLPGDDVSYRVQLNYDGDRYGFVAHRLRVGANFNPEVGFLFRSDVAKFFSRLRFSPRPTSIDAIRRFNIHTEVDYLENGHGQVQTRSLTGQFDIEFENSDLFSLSYNDQREVLFQPFDIVTDVRIPVGDYSFGTLNASYTLGQQRAVSGVVEVEHGTFWDGVRTSVAVSSGRTQISPQLSVEPGLSVNRVTLPFGSFTSNLVSSRVTYTVTPLMFVSGLVQYNSSRQSVESNVRLRWEYQPGSELFVVFKESRDTQQSGFPGLRNRALIVKVNRLMQF